MLAACFLVVAVQSLSYIWLIVTHGLQHTRLLSSTVSLRLLNFRFFELVMLSNHLIPCHPLFLLPSIFSQHLSFPVSQPFASGGQSIGASASTSVLPMNIQGWFPLGLTGLISLQSKGLSRVFSSTTLEAPLLRHSYFFMVQLSHPYSTTGKTIALAMWTFVGKVISLVFNTLSRFCHSFPSSEQVSLDFMATVTVHSNLGANKTKSVIASTFPTSICHKRVVPEAMVLVFWMLSFKPAFSLSSFTFIKSLWFLFTFCY